MTNILFFRIFVDYPAFSLFIFILFCFTFMALLLRNASEYAEKADGSWEQVVKPKPRRGKIKKPIKAY